MLVVVIVMVLILLLAGAIAAYVAFPHRGEDLPLVPWLGDAMTKAADAAPVIEPEGAEGSEDREYEDSDRLI